jgi:hypothetical protein
MAQLGNTSKLDSWCGLKWSHDLIPTKNRLQLKQDIHAHMITLTKTLLSFIKLTDQKK